MVTFPSDVLINFVFFRHGIPFKRLFGGSFLIGRLYNLRIKKIKQITYFKIDNIILNVYNNKQYKAVNKNEESSI